MKTLFREFFYSFGVLCFFALCLYPVYSFNSTGKPELLSISSIEIIDYKEYIFDICWFLLGAGLLTFLIVKNDKKKEKNEKDENTDKNILYL